MNFSDAEILINASILAHYPPIMLVGDNTIGKTTLLQAVAKVYEKKVEFTTGVDFGGLKQYVQYGDKEVHTVILSDIQSILSRKKPVQEATLGYISTLIEEGVNNEITFSKAGRSAQNVKYNMIIGATPRHVVRLIRLGEIDLLTRFLYIKVERNTDNIDLNKGYQLQLLPNTFIDENQLNMAFLDELGFKIKNIRYRKMIATLVSTLKINNYDNDTIIRLVKRICTFTPIDDSEYNWVQLFSQALKPI